MFDFGNFNKYKIEFGDRFGFGITTGYIIKKRFLFFFWKHIKTRKPGVDGSFYDYRYYQTIDMAKEALFDVINVLDKKYFITENELTIKNIIE